MRVRTAVMATTVLGLGAVCAMHGRAIAGPALDADGKPMATQPTIAGEEVLDPNANQEEEPEYGVGIRIREVFIPKSVLQLFVKRAPGGVSNPGAGLELTRRKGNSELQIGVEVEHLHVPQGVWINKGDNVPEDEVDYQLNSGGLGWVTFEFNFIHNMPIQDWLAFRYGGGLGIGVIFGQDEHIDVLCAPGSTNSNVSGCTPMEFGGPATNTKGGIHVPYDLPPVFPVVTGLVGFQFKPLPKWTINVEGGLRTVPFAGISSSYFF